MFPVIAMVGGAVLFGVIAGHLDRKRKGSEDEETTSEDNDSEDLSTPTENC